ncbi:MAG: MFS transporter [Telluria sp.]
MNTRAASCQRPPPSPPYRVASMNQPQSWKTIAILAVTQVVSWGSLYYAFAILGPDIARELGWRAETVFGAFSWSLLVAGLASTPAGILLDRYGGRLVMGSGSLLSGLGFILLSHAHGTALYFLAWTVLGVAMAAVLYEAAFATINHQFGMSARQAISTLTLFGGFASTVFWPLTLKVNTLVGWRDTYLLYGVLQLGLCLPLHLLLTARPAGRGAGARLHGGPDFTLRQALRHPAFWTLAFAFSANSFIFSALSVHLIPILQRFGHSASEVVFMAALIGPMQVAGRIGEMMFARRSRPQTVGKITFGILPGALLALLFFGQHMAAVALFCILYGLSNGILTIVRGTIPQAMFGTRNYGAISGALSGPSLISKAAGPLAIAAVVQFDPAPALLFGLLLACALASLLFYLMAIRRGATGNEAVVPHPASVQVSNKRLD